MGDDPPGADARGLVKPIEPLSIPDIPTPEHRASGTGVPAPSKPAKGEGVEGEGDGAGEVEINLGSLPSASGLFEAPVFAPGASASKWSSPSGLFELMGAAARTGGVIVRRRRLRTFTASDRGRGSVPDRRGSDPGRG